MVWFLSLKEMEVMFGVLPILSEHPTVAGNDGKIRIRYFGGCDKPCPKHVVLYG
jgi:hypothetical protein